LCVHISNVKARTGKNPRDPDMSTINRSTAGIVSREEIRILLENLKTYILGSISE